MAAKTCCRHRDLGQLVVFHFGHVEIGCHFLMLMSRADAWKLSWDVGCLYQFELSQSLITLARLLLAFKEREMNVGKWGTRIVQFHFILDGHGRKERDIHENLGNVYQIQQCHITKAILHLPN